MKGGVLLDDAERDAGLGVAQQELAHDGPVVRDSARGTGVASPGDHHRLGGSAQLAHQLANGLAVGEEQLRDVLVGQGRALSVRLLGDARQGVLAVVEGLTRGLIRPYRWIEQLALAEGRVLVEAGEGDFQRSLVRQSATAGLKRQCW
jgi:hypothetical protein